MPRLIASAVMAVLLITVSAPAGGTVPAAAQAPDVEVAADAIIVDELGDGFIPRGAGWRDGAGGYADHHYWQRAVTARTGRVGTWRVTLPEAGPYRVEAMVPLRHATTKAARYRIGTADGVVVRTVNQSRTRGTWVSLGTYELGATAEVRLSARTADARAGRMVAFDALRFVSVAAPPPPPDPPVISNLDVAPTDTTAVVRFSLDAPGPAKTEYRAAGAVNWLLGADEASSRYADHRQVIRGLVPETAFEVRVIATNAGGRTVSDTVRFTTLAPPPPVIRDISVAPEDTRAVVTFSLGDKGPARTEYRESGDATWTLGAEETSSKYADHRQVIRGLVPETAYELRVIAINAGGQTVSDLVPFKTRQRTVDCGAGDDLQSAIDQARPGDTLLIKGECGTFLEFQIDKDLSLRGVSDDAGLRTVYDFTVSPEHPSLLDISAFRRVSISDLRLSTSGSGIWNRGDVTVDSCTLVGGRRWGIVNEVGARITVRRSRISGFSSKMSMGILNHGELRLVDSTISDISGLGAIRNGSVATVIGSVIENSSKGFGGDGGGIDNTGTLTIESSVVRNNDAEGRGGGIYNGRFLTLVDSEITGNSASDGGGIYNADDISIARTVIQNNTPNDCVGC